MALRAPLPCVQHARPRVARTPPRGAACEQQAARPSSARPQSPPPPERRPARPARAQAVAARPAAGASPAASASAAAFAASAARLPALVRRVLLDGVDPATVDAEALLRALPLRREDKAAALAALAAPEADAAPLVLSRAGALSPAACAALRRLVAARATGAATDSADGCPEWQVNLTRQELDGVIGAAATAALWALPRQLDPQGAPARFTQVRVFARAYGAAKRPHLRLHTDACDYTVNVALADDARHVGGRLALLHAGALSLAPRAEGEATVHRWNVCHGVTAVTEGTRYSLILFFFHRRQPVM
jgi:hypothetical protein